MTKRAQKRKKVTAALIAAPHLSDAAIARATRASNWTVGNYRRKMVAAGEIPYVKDRLGIDGRIGRGPSPYTLDRPLPPRKLGLAQRKPEPHCAMQPIYQAVQS